MLKVNNWLKSARMRVWPQHCQLCGNGLLKANSVLCQPCLGDLPWNTTCCQVCALPLPQNAICGRCLRKPPSYHRTLATFSYQDPLSHIVHGLKYGQRLYYGRFLGNALAEMVAQGAGNDEFKIPDLILPAPLHQRRLNERGYNQALEIAKPVARLLSVSISDRVIVRNTETKEQSQLSALERRRNLKGAFFIKRSMKGLYVVIVDDVMTTGATVSELTCALIKAGARRIDVWVAARAALGGNNSPKT